MEVKNQPNGLDDLELRILETFKSLTKEYSSWQKDAKTNVKLTNEIKSRIGEVLKEKGFEISSSFHNSEWLFDLVAYSTDDKGQLQSIELALESELSGRKEGDLKIDFEKLLAANCKHKIMICFAEGNQRHPENVNNIIAYYETFVNSFKKHSIDARYLTLIWDDYSTGNVYPHLIEPL